MIREDRRQLNERFIKVFKLLEERGEIIKNDRGGKGMGDFAHKVLGNRAYGHIIRAFLNPNDKRCIDYRHARILCREYGINESYMIDGIGSPFGFDIPEIEKLEASDIEGNIMYTTMEAFAGDTIGQDHREEYKYFSIPGVDGGGLVSFRINGRSMEPVIRDNDLVVCRAVEGLHEIKDNKIYAIKNNGNLWVKYIQKLSNNKGRVTKLKLISANHLEYDPFEEDINEHTRFYQVIRRISDLA